MKKYLKILSIIPLYLLSLIVVFIVLIKLPDSFWGCQGFGCFGVVFAIPYLTVLLAIPTSLFLYLFIYLVKSKKIIFEPNNTFHKLRLIFNKKISLPVFIAVLIISLLILLFLSLKLLLNVFYKSRVIPSTTMPLNYDKNYSYKPSDSVTIIPKPTVKVTPTPTISVSNWKTYTNFDYKYSFKYPSDYSVSSENERVTVRSTPTQCQTGGFADKPVPITGYDTEITIIYHVGDSYKDMWKKAFDFEFDPSNPNLSSDGEKTISGKSAYYFFQQAESPYGRTAYLVELTPTTALEINLYVPVLLFNCERPLDQFKGQQIADTILSTFEFLK